MRVKRGVTAKAKHNKIHRANKGYRMTKRRLTRVAKEAYLHAGEYAYAGRKLRKRDMRRLWIMRISEAVRQNGLSYSMFVSRLKAANIEVDRKILANLILENPDAFAEILDKIKTVN
ncbi:50S ribosomal protein L20 [Candidatus Gottesmanbacteria bacterium RBG_16_52_11]|uniref:Large ribosomal subunit protein bL20 n=1 Tax=Candidatus Gottesmanbacteria bacterium RBG_16_52_11 TaxID=1798374 RepID=A0A1F5YNU8_9BACT|nr:MAG: 50S ribosomal protein L20 [Candidatus Gottesmanbacteria bacterium RBG_16_52_11]